MKQFIIVLIFSCIYVNRSQAQGCVAIRSNGASCTRPLEDSLQQGWQINMGYRYFKSFRHFIGKKEQHERIDSGTDVRNWSNALDLTITKKINNRWSLGINMPIINNVRSSKYEHYGNTHKSALARRNTRSFGIGDTRLMLGYWLLDPETHPFGNIQAAIGLKLPTGDYKVSDFFYKNDTTPVLGPVDQSIQLGDGGTGLSVEVNGYYQINHAFGVYGTLYYLSNPMEQNGVSTARGAVPTTTALQYGTSTMSVPDQYMVRGGINYMYDRWGASMGMRMEGIPSTDLIGGSSGFRRPGYVINIEPGVNYMLKQGSLFITIPVAMERNRTQSYADKLRTSKTGVYVHGDAAFADYSVNIGWSIRL